MNFHTYYTYTDAWDPNEKTLQSLEPSNGNTINLLSVRKKLGRSFYFSQLGF